MPRSFRFQPPSPRSLSLTRPRLLRALLGRWEHRVTTVVGGAGLGKTTLLAQVVAENRLAPRGDDVWLGIEPGDAERASLARDALAAVAVGPPPSRDAPGSDAPGPPDPEAVADAVWRRSPAAVCLVFDDVHLLPAGSAGAAWLAGLVEALPANGHVLLAGRTDPPVPLARWAAMGELLHLGEDDLRFTDDELTSFAADRGVADVGGLGSAGGWPAIAELAASVPSHHAGDYLWEEVLAPLGEARRRVLAVVADLGGADDALASAALGEPVDLDAVLDGVPLVAADDHGWRAPHPLWRSTPALTLEPSDQRAVRRRAIDHLLAGGRFDDALTLAGGAELDDVVPSILRAACLGPGRPPVDRLARWLADMPAAARGTSGAALAVGLHQALVSPAEAIEPLGAAAALFRAEDDADGELAAIALMGRVAWWLARLDVLAEVFPRVLELEAAGHGLARALAAIGRAVLADLDGDDDAVLDALDGIEPRTLDPSWAAVADWLRASTLVGRGRPAEALAVLDGIAPSGDPAFAATTDGGRLTVLWSLGEVDLVAAELPALLDRVRAAGLMQNVLVALTQAAILQAMLGDVGTARGHMAEARRVERGSGTGATTRLAVAEATVLAAAGDEEGAAALLDATLASRDALSGSDRRPWRASLPLTYVLVPAVRAAWDDAALEGYLDDARALARTVVGLRAGEPTAAAALVARGVPPVAIVRSTLLPAFAVELAAGLHACGAPEGAALLDALGTPGRAAARALAGGATAAAGPARALLAAVPAPPPHPLDVGVLGPLEVASGGRSVSRELRRGRVRALLSYLVAHPKTTRSAVVAALWPDLDERAAANNFRVTLNYLLAALEPWRGKGEPSFFVRLDGATVALAVGEWLRVDAHLFDDHVRQATRADADGAPSVALDHALAATALYRGPAHQDAGDAEWVDAERAHYATRFVTTAVRAGQLLVGRGEVERAEELAGRALAVDPWCEDAYAVSVAAALERGDRVAARHTFERADAALAELGAEPSPELQRLRRRLRYRS
jgi:ATP/maltotriose-dependent transcriptional regulator MalT/DNA-binding SARP family transcriptional activator